MEAVLIGVLLFTLRGPAAVGTQLLTQLAVNGMYTTLVFYIRNGKRPAQRPGLGRSKGFECEDNAESAVDSLRAEDGSASSQSSSETTAFVQQNTSGAASSNYKQPQLSAPPPGCRLDNMVEILLRDPALRLPPEVQSMLALLSRGGNTAAAAAAQPGTKAFAGAYQPMCTLTTVGIKVDHHPADFGGFSAHMAAAVAGTLQQRLGAESLPKLVSVCVPGCVLLLGCSMTMPPPGEEAGTPSGGSSNEDTRTGLSAMYQALPNEAHAEAVHVRYVGYSRTFLPPNTTGNGLAAVAAAAQATADVAADVSMWLLQPCVADGAESEVAVAYSSAPLGSEYRIVLYQDGVVLQDVKHVFEQSDGVVRLPFGEHRGHVVHVAMVVDDRYVVLATPVLLLPAEAMEEIERVHGCSSAHTDKPGGSDSDSQSLRRLVADIAYLTADEPHQQRQRRAIQASLDGDIPDGQAGKQLRAALTCHVLDYLTAHDMWHCVRHLLTVMYGEPADTAVAINDVGQSAASGEVVAVANAAEAAAVAAAVAGVPPPLISNAQHQPSRRLRQRSVGPSLSGSVNSGQWDAEASGSGSSASSPRSPAASPVAGATAAASAGPPSQPPRWSALRALRTALRGHYDRRADERAYLQYKGDTTLVLDAFGAIFHAGVILSFVVPRRAHGQHVLTWRDQTAIISLFAFWTLPTVALLLFRAQTRRAREWLLVVPSVGAAAVHVAAALALFKFPPSARVVICRHLTTRVIIGGIVRPSAIQVRFPLHAVAFALEFGTLAWLQYVYGNSWRQVVVGAVLTYGVSCAVGLWHEVCSRRQFEQCRARLQRRAKEA